MAADTTLIHDLVSGGNGSAYGSFDGGTAPLKTDQRRKNAFHTRYPTPQTAANTINPGSKNQRSGTSFPISD